MTRYVVIGAGAVGATIAAQLHLAGREVVMVARGAHLEKLRAHGLTYIRPEGTKQLHIPVAGGPSEIGLTLADALLFTTKSQDTEAALQEWAWVATEPHGRPAATVLSVVMLQNGFDNERAALRRFATVYGSAMTLPATFLHPGEVVARATLPGAFWIGHYPHGDADHDAELGRYAADLRLAGFAVQTVPDIVRWKAGKLVINLHNAIDALFGRRPTPLRDAVIAALRQEAAQVLQAAGIATADLATESTQDLSGLDEQITGMAQRPAEEWKHSSTWQSMSRAGSVESDYLNGEIVLLARLHGLSAPLNATLQRLIGQASQQGNRPGGLTQDDLRRLFPLGD